jgi:cobalt-zinc-cadmium efflux system membrane fusion protein
LAQNTYAREKRLWEEKITAEQDYRQAEQSWQEAQITLSAIGQKLSALGLDAGAASGSLNRFALRAPFDGVVIEKNLSLGQALKDDAAVFVVADLRQVWVELQVPAQALPQLKVGELVQVQASAFSAQAKGKIAFVGSLLGEQTRTATARVVLDNAQGQWRPGLFVNVAVAASQEQAPVTVRNEALQTVEGKTVVFVRTAQGFAARPVELGISDGVRSAVKKGLQAGERYAAVGSFVLKAELGKSEAAHEH